MRKSRQMLNEIGREPTPEGSPELGMPLEGARVLKTVKEPYRWRPRSATRRTRTSATSSRTRTRCCQSTR